MTSAMHGESGYPRVDDDKASPRHNFAWYVWDHSYPSPGVSAPALKYDQ